jgi:hypothetical protein
MYYKSWPDDIIVVYKSTHMRLTYNPFPDSSFYMEAHTYDIKDTSIRTGMNRFMKDVHHYDNVSDPEDDVSSSMEFFDEYDMYESENRDDIIVRGPDIDTLEDSPDIPSLEDGPDIDSPDTDSPEDFPDTDSPEDSPDTDSPDIDIEMSQLYQTVSQQYHSGFMDGLMF